MPIRWDTLKVTAACDMLEERFKQVAEPLEDAKTIAQEARKIKNLPQYVTQYLTAIVAEVSRTEGRFNDQLAQIRKAIPKDALKQDVAKASRGEQPSLSM